jgi:LuxR family maltose regulon positive regulatory protein
MIPDVFLITCLDPPFPLARLRARGGLGEVRQTDLAFTSEETAAFFRGYPDLHCSPDDVKALEGRTEGWVTGLQLAALSLRGQDDASAFLSSFSGSHRYVLDYLVEEVLERQKEATRAFLLRTSVLERLCGALCDAVTESDGGQERLEELEGTGLFIVPLDDTRTWYRYHPFSCARSS